MSGYADELVSLFVSGGDNDEALEDPAPTDGPFDKDVDPEADD